MSHKLLPLALTLGACPALAEAPAVSVDIAPVHSLVAQVMQGVGTPDLIVDPGISPHDYRMRPSDAQAMQDADLVFWVGEGLTPWLERAIGTLASEAVVVELLEVDGLPLLDNRENAIFGDPHDHDDDHEGHDEHAEDHHDDEHDHDDHAEHDEDKHEEHADGHEGHHDEEEHAEGHLDEHGHDHGAHDPHAWLSPEFASLWLGAIAETLATADPENADTYMANAAASQASLDALSAQAEERLANLRGKPFVVFHDAYQYFEVAFDIPSAGAILIGDASDPSPGRIAEVQDVVRERGITCALAEPQFNQNLLDVVTEGGQINSAVIDPLGAFLTPGPDLYPTLIENMVASLEECLS